MSSLSNVSSLSAAPHSVLLEQGDSFSAQPKTKIQRVSGSSGSSSSFLVSSSSSSSRWPALSLRQLPNVLISEIFSFLAVNQFVHSTKLSRHIRAVLLSRPLDHCVLDGCEKNFDSTVAQRFINSRNFQIIRTIDLRNTPVYAIGEIFTSGMPQLKTLSFHTAKKDVTRILSTYCPQLTSLDFDGEASNQNLSTLNLPNLTKLDLGGSEPILINQMLDLAVNHPKLQWLSFLNNMYDSCREITGKGDWGTCSDLLFIGFSTP